MRDADVVVGLAGILHGLDHLVHAVVEGLDVVEKIEAVPVTGEAPVTRIEVTRVRVLKPEP